MKHLFKSISHALHDVFYREDMIFKLQPNLVILQRFLDHS